MPDTPDFIWIQDAATEYKRSRKWLDDQIAAGKLSVVNIPGDRRVYLLRSEIDKLLRPQITRGGASDAGNQAG
jgi:hypothetical protein